MELISITRIDVLNSKIPNFKLSYLKVTKDSVPHFNSYLDQKNYKLIMYGKDSNCGTVV